MLPRPSSTAGPTNPWPSLGVILSLIVPDRQKRVPAGLALTALWTLP